MDYLKLNENVCRICLDSNIFVNWNEEICESYGMSYRDCYYKYTHLWESDSSSYPTNLCENCSNGLKNAHVLFEKALESFNILRIALAESKYIIPDEKKIEIGEEVFLSPLPSGRKVETEELNSEDHSEKISVGEHINIEPAHFVDITNLGSFSDTSLEQQLAEISDNDCTNSDTIMKGNKSETEAETSLTRHIVTKETGKRKDKCKSVTKSSCEELSIRSSNKLPNASASQKSEKRNQLNNHLLLDSVESCDANPSVSKLTKPRKKREKLCQYCSLKFDDTRIKQHEATHSENRERNVICPQCGIKLYSKDSLMGHMKIHLENRQKNQKCEFCEKAFFNKGALNVHRRVHLGQMVTCPICSKEYYRQIDLDKHLLIHSASPLQKSVEKVKYTIQCQYCNKAVLSNIWKVHKAAHLNQPQTKCKICDKNFFSRASCRKHIQRLHRIREFTQFIYHYDDSKLRMSHLMMTQQEKVQAVTE